MKNKLKELLSQDDGVLKINSMFYLKRWVLNPETDILGRSEEHLTLVMNNRYKTSKRITSRDTKGIMEEVSLYMSEMMDNYKEDIIRRFKGGMISEYF